MLAVLGRLQATPYVFKGGSALAFVYGLDRHSTDLDFDADGPVAIEDLVEAGLNDAGVVLTDFIVGKDSDIGQRFKVHYARTAIKSAASGLSPTRSIVATPTKARAV